MPSGRKNIIIRRKPIHEKQGRTLEINFGTGKPESSNRKTLKLKKTLKNSTIIFESEPLIKNLFVGYNLDVDKVMDKLYNQYNEKILHSVFLPAIINSQEDGWLSAMALASEEEYKWAHLKASLALAIQESLKEKQKIGEILNRVQDSIDKPALKILLKDLKAIEKYNWGEEYIKGVHEIGDWLYHKNNWVYEYRMMKLAFKELVTLGFVPLPKFFNAIKNHYYIGFTGSGLYTDIVYNQYYETIEEAEKARKTKLFKNFTYIHQIT